MQLDKKGIRETSEEATATVRGSQVAAAGAWCVLHTVDAQYMIKMNENSDPKVPVHNNLGIPQILDQIAQCLQKLKLVFNFIFLS